jgi:hypothetical protein
MKCKSSKRKAVIEDATTDQMRALTEIAHNIVNKNFIISPETLEELNKHKTSIRRLSKKTKSHKDKKKFLVQEGGFLPFLITPVLSALGAVAGRALGSQLGI